MLKKHASKAIRAPLTALAIGGTSGVGLAMAKQVVREGAISSLRNDAPGVCTTGGSRDPLSGRNGA